MLAGRENRYLQCASAAERRRKLKGFIIPQERKIQRATKLVDKSVRKMKDIHRKFAKADKSAKKIRAIQTIRHAKKYSLGTWKTVLYVKNC
jgi:hypothetical protein